MEITYFFLLKIINKSKEKKPLYSAWHLKAIQVHDTRTLQQQDPIPLKVSKDYEIFVQNPYLLF